MNKTASIIIVVALIIGLGIVFWGESKDTPTSEGTVSAENVEIRDGIQYVTIHAKGGYSPRISTATANLPTKLIVKTNGTYDCSTALVIRSINYQKVLPSTGEEIIDLGTPQPGTLKGLCSMGMYNFSINFKIIPLQDSL
jgi:plastocyanin domain-containing protein